MMAALGRRGIAADELVLTYQTANEIAERGRHEAAGPVALADHEQQPLLLGEPPVDFGDRQMRIPAVDGLSADAIDLDDGKALPAHQRIQALETQVEAAVVEFAHAARDRVEALVEGRRDVAVAVAIERAGTLIVDQRDA